MPLFGKRIPDDDWKRRVVPLYTSAVALCDRFRTAMSAQDAWGEEQVAATSSILRDLPPLVEELKASPDPTSTEARQATSDLKKALSRYITAAKLAGQLLQDLVKGLGERASYSGMARGRIAMHLAHISSEILSAWQEMARANAYFERATKSEPSMQAKRASTAFDGAARTPQEPLRSVPATIRCISCGKEVSRQMIACPNCGTPVGYKGGTPLGQAGASPVVSNVRGATGEFQQFGGHKAPVISVAFSPDGRLLLSADSSGTVLVREVQSGREVHRWEAEKADGDIDSGGDEGEQAIVYSVAFSPDGRYAVSGARNGGVFILDLETGQELGIFDVAQRDDPLFTDPLFTAATSVALLPDKHEALVGDSEGRIWRISLDTQTHRTVRSRRLGKYNIHGLPVRGIAISPNGHHVMSWHGVRRKDHVLSAACLWSLQHPRRQPLVLSGPGHGHFSWFDGPDLNEAKNREAEIEVTCVAFSPDGHWALVSGYIGDATGFIRLYDVTSERMTSFFQGIKVDDWDKEQVYRLKKYPSDVAECAAFPPDGRLVVCCAGEFIGTWDTDSFEQILAMDISDQPAESIQSVAFSPLGNQLALGDYEGTVCVLTLPK